MNEKGPFEVFKAVWAVFWMGYISGFGLAVSMFGLVALMFR